MNRVFGLTSLLRMRPSWGAIDLTKVIPSAVSMDTLGLFARSASLLEKVMGAWETAEKSPLLQGNFTLPKKIIYPVGLLLIPLAELGKGHFRL